MIDISGLFSADVKERQMVAQQMKQACEDKGFFYISNHGIATELQQAVFKQSKQFFDLPMNEKKKYIRKTQLPIGVMNL